MRRSALRSVGLLTLATFCGPASAALVNCAQLAGYPELYKVGLDEIVYATSSGASDARQTALMDRLQFTLHGSLEDLQDAAARLERLSIPLQLITCTGRRPQMSGSDFTASEAGELSDNRVVLEMWGSVEPGTAAGHGASEAHLAYTIPPLQHYFPDGSPTSLVMVLYPKPHSTLSAERSLERLSEVPAFVLIGVGTKAARAHQYDAAVWAFTQSRTYLQEAQLSGDLPALKELLIYVGEEACRTRHLAQIDPTYTGALRAVPAGNCTSTGSGGATP